MFIKQIFLPATAAALALGAFALTPATAQQSEACDVKVQTYWNEVLQSENVADTEKRQIQEALSNALRHVQMGNEDACEQTLQQVKSQYEL